MTPQDLPGVSTNCQVPDLVASRVLTALGHIPELEDLSLEVLVGHCSRDSALAQLEAVANAMHTQ